MKKLKLLLCLSTALLISTSVQAGWQGNWLVGVSGAYNWGDADLDIATVDVNGLNPVSFNVDEDNHNERWMWGILAGYQARCNGWLLGAEVNVDWQNNHDDNQSIAFVQHAAPNIIGATASYDRDATVGLTGRLGYALNDWFMPYLRAGIETSRDEVEYNSLELPSNVLLSAEGSRRSYRFVGGIGAEMPVPVMQCLSFRVEYNYHSKGKTIDATGLSSDSLTTVNISAKPSQNTAKASLVWNFG